MSYAVTTDSACRMLLFGGTYSGIPLALLDRAAIDFVVIGRQRRDIAERRGLL
jgi:hypothetical protein